MLQIRSHQLLLEYKKMKRLQKLSGLFTLSIFFAINLYFLIQKCIGVNDKNINKAMAAVALLALMIGLANDCISLFYLEKKGKLLKEQIDNTKFNQICDDKNIKDLKDFSKNFAPMSRLEKCAGLIFIFSYIAWIICEITTLIKLFKGPQPIIQQSSISIEEIINLSCSFGILIASMLILISQKQQCHQSKQRKNYMPIIFLSLGIGVCILKIIGNALNASESAGHVISPKVGNGVLSIGLVLTTIAGFYTLCVSLYETNRYFIENPSVSIRQKLEIDVIDSCA